MTIYNINVARAMQMKNRAASDLNQLRAKIVSCHRVEDGTPPPTLDLDKAMQTVYLLHKDLCALKTAIGQAMTPEVIAILKELEELKSLLSWLNSLALDPVMDEKFIRRIDPTTGAMTGGDTKVWTRSCIKQEDVQNERRELQDRIDALQSSLDNHNFTYRVQVEISSY